MINKAIILFSDYSENDKISRWCTKEIASIPLYKRVILSACKAGIKEFVFFGCDIKEKIEYSIKSDKRINADIKWYGKNTYEQLDEIIANEVREDPNIHFFIIKANALFDYNILNRLSGLSFDNAVAAIAIKKTTSIPSENNSMENNLSILSVKNEMNGGIIIASHKIKDFLNPVDGDFSLCKLRERLSKEDLLNTVEVKDYLYEEINSQSSILSSEKKLFQSLGSSSDSPIIDKLIIRKISGVISKLSLRTSITPNQITLVSMIFGLLSGVFFSFGGYAYNISAGLLYFLSVIFDQCDGEVARLKYMESEYGNILDIICDTIVNAAIVVGITCSIYKTTGSNFTIMLGLFALVGISISLLLVTYFEEKGKHKTTDKKKGFLDKLNNKDFFYIIIIVCIFINQMIWFLLVMAIGTNIYWVIRKIVHR